MRALARHAFFPHATRKGTDGGAIHPREIHRQALHNPTELSYDPHGRVLIKKLYRVKDRERLLLIVGEEDGDVLNIITVIDTSKVKKYL